MKRILCVATLLAACGAASAHTGHATASLVDGLFHPVGADHLLAMVAVGIWSAAAWTGVRRALGPLVFLVAMSVGAILGAIGGVPPGLEAAIAVSVMLLGVMLAVQRRLPPRPGLALVGAAAVLHGLAHGAELPAGGSMAAYAAGFLAATAVLHGVGLALGMSLRAARPGLWPAIGAGFGVAGIWLIAGA
jgi:urease accessory protein